MAIEFTLSRPPPTSFARPPSPTPLADQVAVEIERGLVVRARGGDARAFRALFEKYGPPVRRFLRDLLGDSDADEATQETFVRAYRCLPTLRETDKLLPWLLGIARNVFHEQLRARRGRALGPSIGLLASPGLLAEEPLVDTAPTPEGLLLGHEADRLLAEALALLSEERRAALLLRVDHGLDYEEIRTVLGWSLAKVKNEIHRARLELRARLAKYLGGRE